MLLGASWFGENSSSGDLHSDMFKDYDLMDIIQDNTFEDFNMADDVLNHQEKVGDNNNPSRENFLYKSPTTAPSPVRMNLFDQLFSSTQKNILHENGVSLNEEISSNPLEDFMNNNDSNLTENQSDIKNITNDSPENKIKINNDKNVFDIILKDNHVLKKEFLSTPLISSLPLTSSSSLPLTSSSSLPLTSSSSLPHSSLSSSIVLPQHNNSAHPVSKPSLKQITIIQPKPSLSSPSTTSKMISKKSLFVKLDVSTLKTPCIQFSSQINNNNHNINNNSNTLTNNVFNKNVVKTNPEVKNNKLNHEKSQRTKRVYKRKANLNNKSKSSTGRKKNIVKKEERIHEIGPGLANLGNTCFLNSTVQCLTHLPPLRHHFMHHHDYCMEWQNCVVCDVGRHIKGCFHEDRQAVFKPYNILKLCKATVPHIRWGRQEDAHDLLRCLLDSMHTNALQNNHRLRHHHSHHHHHILNSSVQYSRLVDKGKDGDVGRHVVNGGKEWGGDDVNNFFDQFSNRFEHNQGYNDVNNDYKDRDNVFDNNLPNSNQDSPLLRSVNICKSHNVNNHKNKSNYESNNNTNNNNTDNKNTNDNNKNNNNNKKTSLVHDIFAGKLRSQVRCTECGSSTETDDTFLDVCVDISKHHTLHQNLVSFFQEEIIDDGVRAYHCARCNKPVPATKRFSIQQAPQVLTIQLKRYNSSGSKVSKHISFTTTLDILPFTTKEHATKSTSDNKTENINDLLNNGFINGDNKGDTHNTTTSVSTNENTTTKSENNSNNTPSTFNTTGEIINGERKMVIKGGDGEVGEGGELLNERLGSGIMLDKTAPLNGNLTVNMPYDEVNQVDKPILHTFNNHEDETNVNNTKIQLNKNFNHNSFQTTQENTIMGLNTDTKPPDTPPDQKSPQETTNSSHHYTLFAVLVHNGCSINNGHYYCYVNSLPKHRPVYNGAVSNGDLNGDDRFNNDDNKLTDKTFLSSQNLTTNNVKNTSINSTTNSAYQSLSNQWYRMNDHQVVACSQDEVMSSEAYMLFYCHLSSLPCHVFSSFVHPHSSIHPACVSFNSQFLNGVSMGDVKTKQEVSGHINSAASVDTHTTQHHTKDIEAIITPSHNHPSSHHSPHNTPPITKISVSKPLTLHKPLKSILKHHPPISNDHHAEVRNENIAFINRGKLYRHNNNNGDNNNNNKSINNNNNFNNEDVKKNGSKSVKSHKILPGTLNKKNTIKYNSKTNSLKNNHHSNNNQNNNKKNSNIPSYLMNLLKPQKVLPSSPSSSSLTSFKIPLISKNTHNDDYDGDYHHDGEDMFNSIDVDNNDNGGEFGVSCDGNYNGDGVINDDEDDDDGKLMICNNNEDDFFINYDVELKSEPRLNNESVKKPFKIKRLTKNKCHTIPEGNGKFENISKTVNILKVPPLRLKRNYEEKDHYYVVRS